MNKSTVYKLIGSNKLVANKRFMDLITTLLEFPEMVLTQKQNKLLFWSTKLCNHQIFKFYKYKDYDLNKVELSS